MFGSMRKKRRQPAQPLTSATADPSAATAAAAVFGRRNSNTSLSSAAAAAALRSRPTTPINVGEVQTKRTMRRSASQSSHGSAHDPRRSLQRSPSQNSMTERTFRSPSPSPHRPATSAGYEEPPPPVPAIPEDMRSDDGKGSKKRSVQMYTQPFRVASQKKQEGGSWFGAAAAGNASNVRTADAALRTKSPEPRHGAVSPSPSINFSYPRGTRVASPPASLSIKRTMSMTQSQRYVAPRRVQSTTTLSPSHKVDEELVFDPNSRRMVPKAEFMAMEQDEQDTPQRPVRKKQQPAALNRSGSHLSKGSVSRLKGTAVEGGQASPKAASPGPGPSRAVESPEPKTLHHPGAEETPAAAIVSRPNSTHPEVKSEAQPQKEPELEHEPEQHVTKDVRVSDGATVLPGAQPKAATPIIGRLATVGDESSEDEDDHEAPSTTQDNAAGATDTADFAPVREAASPPPQAPIIPADSISADSPAERTPSSVPVMKQHGSVRSARESSNSPVRTPRFAVTPDQLVVKHEPPPRSISPRKSALKNSTSPSRGASPSEDGSEASAFGSMNERDNSDIHRKKSVRVSFDDQNTKVIGEAAQDQHSDSPIMPSPQASRRPWYSNIGRNKKKDALLDDDEVMKPRPALPMFGSVREKKTRETEERPLVRPLETARSPLSSTPTMAPSSPDDEPEDPMGQSSDHNIAGVLNQDLTSRNEANTSRYREPLPPVVTSLEGSGYYSPSSSSSADEDELEDNTAATTQPDADSVMEPEQNLPPKVVKDEILAGDTAGDTPGIVQNGATHDNIVRREVDTIPTISIIQPSPRNKEPKFEEQSATEEQPLKPGYFDVPGGFPDDEQDDHQTAAQAKKTAEQQTQSSRPADIMPGDFGDDDFDDAPSSPVANLPQVGTIEEETEASSGDSIYSDAYEDMSEAEGDGFMSLDAVLTTPVSKKVSQKLFEKALAGSASDNGELMTPTAQHTPMPATDGAQSATETKDDWDKAKAYWKGLTLDKRRQLEREALEDAGAEADREAAPAPVPKQKKKKSKAAAVPESRPAAPEKEIDPSRIYQIKPGTQAKAHDQEHAISAHSGGNQQQAQVGAGKLRKSMRGSQQVAASAPVAETSMRRTLRSNTEENAGTRRPQGSEPTGGRMRKSLRQNGAPQPVVEQPRVEKPARPVSLPQPPKQQTTSKQQKRATLDSASASAALANVQPTLRRRGSDSSETSFKRSKPARQGFGFRKSMRDTSPERPGTAGRSSRFSIRSMSPPPASQPPSAMGNRMSMRSTLRSDSSDAGSTRMRIPGFGRKKTAEKRPERRYDDSSDDEVHANQSTRRSRFVDSSDEEEPTPIAKPSGLAAKSMRNGGASSSAAAAAMRSSTPRVEDRAESPDLPDSDDEEVPPQRTVSGRLLKPQNGGQGLQRKRSGRGELLTSTTTPTAEAPVRPGHSRRGSFFSVLRRKKDKDAGKISRPERTDSFARQGTKLERSTEELGALRGHDASPKLQKRNTSSWPLPDSTGEEKRPSTAGNVAPPPMAGKSSFKRRSTSYQGIVGHRPDNAHRQFDEESAVDGQSQADGSVKKKKFGKLRKMFGLHD